jgi:hypothetical protein
MIRRKSVVKCPDIVGSTGERSGNPERMQPGEDSTD